MLKKSSLGMFLMALVLSVPKLSEAQVAVIDVASIVQLVQEVQELQQQVATAQSQLAQAQSQYAAITGNRGMQLLLSGTVRNYLPTNWAQLSQAISGSSSGYPALAAEISALIGANAILTPAQVAALAPTQQAQLLSARQSPATLQALARSALANSSDRFAALQQLISTIGVAGDEKASLDLTARITAEQGMLQNEATKLQMLTQVTQSEQWARSQRLREQAILDQGSLRLLPAMGL